MKQIPDIDSLQGIWKRNYIRREDGSEDTTSSVWWFQGPLDFTDLRIPAGRPDFSGVRAWDECSLAQQEWLKTQKGFAGTLTSERGVWVWNRELNIETVEMSARDIGTLEFSDDTGHVMIERALDDSYSEEWERIHSGKAYSLRSNQGIMIVVGGDFLVARHSGDVLLEISKGRAVGSMDDWIISESTLAWLEGHKLFLNVHDRQIWQEPSMSTILRKRAATKA